MIKRELNENASINYVYEFVMQIANIFQIALLCATMQNLFVSQTEIYSTCLVDSDTNMMPLGYQKFQMWLAIEAGLIMAVIAVNSVFLFLRALFTQRGFTEIPAISRTHTEETDYIVAM